MLGRTERDSGEQNAEKQNIWWFGSGRGLERASIDATGVVLYLRPIGRQQADREPAVDDLEELEATATLYRL